MSLNFVNAVPPAVFHEDDAPRPRRLRGALLILVALVAIATLLALFVLGSFVQASMDARDAVVSARSALAGADLSLARTEAAEAERAFHRARTSWKFFGWMKILPIADEAYVNTATVLSAGEDLSRVFGTGLDQVLEVFRLLPSSEELWPWKGRLGSLLALWPDVDEQTRQLLLQRIHSLLPDVELARADVSAIADVLGGRGAASASRWVGLSPEQLQTTVRQLENVLDQAIPWIAVAPKLAGADGDSHLLVLLLNNSELRPGGGFIGSFAVADMRAGLLEGLTHYDVMAVDGPVLKSWRVEPPTPLADYLGVPAWFMRDANWSPDAAVAMENTVRFMRQELAAEGTKAPFADEPFTAVIGVNVTFAQDLLRIVGPITIDRETFTADNIPEAINESVEFGFVDRGVPPNRRKEVIGKMIREMVDRVTELDAWQWNAVLAAAKRRTAERHVFLWSEEEDLERLLDAYHLSGRLPPTKEGEDTLMVVDANLASLKTDPAVERSLAYAFEEQPDGGLEATTTMSYRHTENFSKMVTRYRTYVRFYAPLGSTLLSGTGADSQWNVDEELGRTVFGAFVSIEPLTARDVTVRYRLSDAVAESARVGSYRLSVLKQAGAQDIPLTLDLQFGTRIVHATPPEEAVAWGDRSYRLNTLLDQDKTFYVELPPEKNRD